MYESHEQLFDLDDKCILWKYMSFSKFINILKGKMYFNRLDSFEDVFEGTFPQYNVEHRKDFYGDQVIPQNAYDTVEQVMKKSIYVSCFHRNEFETAFMWKQYADNDGVAIKTTLKRLKDSFHKTPENIHISAVRYIDYNKNFMPEGNAFYLALYKRKSFEPENEVRCIYWKQLKTKNTLSDPSEAIIDLHEKTSFGENIDIDLNMLIEEIYISPYASSYIKENVELITNKFNISAKVIQSQLFTLN